MGTRPSEPSESSAADTSHSWCRISGLTVRLTVGAAGLSDRQPGVLGASLAGMRPRLDAILPMQGRERTRSSDRASTDLVVGLGVGGAMLRIISEGSWGPSSVLGWYRRRGSLSRSGGTTQTIGDKGLRP